MHYFIHVIKVEVDEPSDKEITHHTPSKHPLVHLLAALRIGHRGWFFN